MRFSREAVTNSGVPSRFGGVGAEGVSSKVTQRCPKPTPRHAPNAICGIRELDAGALVLRAPGEQLAMQPPEGLGRTVIRAQPEHQPAARLDEPASAVDQLLDDRLQASALGGVAHRRILAQQPALAHQVQDVHRQCRQLAHQVVGVELARGQPLQIEVGLELAVELLVRAMVGVQIDDVLCSKLAWGQRCGPAFKCVVR